MIALIYKYLISFTNTCQNGKIAFIFALIFDVIPAKSLK